MARRGELIGRGVNVWGVNLLSVTFPDLPAEYVRTSVPCGPTCPDHYYCTSSLSEPRLNMVDQNI